MLDRSLRPPPPQQAAAQAEAGPGGGEGGGNVDRVLFKNLVEMVPLVESLMVSRASAGFGGGAQISSRVMSDACCFFFFWFGLWDGCRTGGRTRPTRGARRWCTRRRRRRRWLAARALSLSLSILFCLFYFILAICCFGWRG